MRKREAADKKVIRNPKPIALTKSKGGTMLITNAFTRAMVTITTILMVILTIWTAVAYDLNISTNNNALLFCWGCFVGFLVATFLSLKFSPIDTDWMFRRKP
jgi:hypothetical protein